MTKESDIAYENGNYWVLKDVRAYHVMRNRLTHAESESAYELSADGLSIAKARVDWLARSDKARAVRLGAPRVLGL